MKSKINTETSLLDGLHPIPEGSLRDSQLIDWVRYQWQDFDDADNSVPLFDVIPNLFETIEQQLVSDDAFVGVFYQEPVNTNDDLGYFEINCYFAIRLCRISRTIITIIVTSDRTIFSPHYSLVRECDSGTRKEFIHLDSPRYSEIIDFNLYLEERFGVDMVEHLEESYQRYVPFSHRHLKKGILPLKECS